MAFHLAEKLRTVTQGASFAEVGKVITSCFGIAAYRLCDTIETLMARADRQLHRAKQGGRDRAGLDYQSDTVVDPTRLDTAV